VLGDSEDYEGKRLGSGDYSRKVAVAQRSPGQGAKKPQGVATPRGLGMGRETVLGVGAESMGVRNFLLEL